MPLQEHRHRLHKHKNSFTGHDGVSFFHEALQSNSLFNSQVTREQACQLLKQFLKSDLISPVNCSSSIRSTYCDSHKYLYEFTNQLLHFQRLKPLSMQSSVNCNQMDDSTHKENYINAKSIVENSWKSAVINSSSEIVLKCVNTRAEVELYKIGFLECRASSIPGYYSFQFNNASVVNLLEDVTEVHYSVSTDFIELRIIELLKPFDASDLMDFSEISPKWVATNANPEWNKIKWNTELPHWILSTMQQLIKYSSDDHFGNVYPTFHVDAFQVISDYFRTLENPIILQCFYKLFLDIFSYLDGLNDIEKDKFSSLKMSTSQEDLLISISSPERRKNRKEIILSNNNLPPNHCYEVAFVSDDPTIRVVPQCSIDSIHLQNNNKCLPKKREISLRDLNGSSKQNFKLYEERKNISEHKTMPLQTIDNFISPKQVVRKEGIVNEGFAIFSPNKVSCQENLEEPVKYRSVDCLNVKYSSSIKESMKGSMTNINCGYINHGLSFSLEDMNLLINDRLDYNYALESLDKLMKVSKYNQSTSDDDYSFHTALSSSEADPSEFEDNISTLVPKDTNWSFQINYLGVTIFQLLLMLLPPCNRAQLRYLSILMYEVSRKSSRSELSLPKLLLKLNKSILRPGNDDSYNESTINRILSFIINNHNEIFTDMLPEIMSIVTNEIYEEQFKISSKVFLRQKSTESNIVLNELLDHIVNNSIISDKEKRRHLKMFKESYPTIYKSRFHGESITSKSKLLSAFKSFRL